MLVYILLSQNCKLHLSKCRKICCKTYFSAFLFAYIPKKYYFCTVFFMVLDLRLIKDWVVGMTILLFLSHYQVHLFALQAHA